MTTNYNNNNNGLDSLSAFRKTVMSMSTTSITKLFPAEEQQKIALQFIHEQLPDTLITDLSKDLADGTIIITILQKITGKQVRGLQRRSSQQNKFKAIYSLENVTLALNFMVENGMLSNHSQIGPDEICAGNTKMILAVIWAMIRHAEEKRSHEKAHQPKPAAAPQQEAPQQEAPQPPPEESDTDSEETEAPQPKGSVGVIVQNGSHDSDDDSSDSDSDLNTLSSSGSGSHSSGAPLASSGSGRLSSSGSAINSSFLTVSSDPGVGIRIKKNRSTTVSTSSARKERAEDKPKEKKEKKDKGERKEKKEKKEKKDKKDKKERKHRHKEHKEKDSEPQKEETPKEPESKDNKDKDEQKGITRSRSFSESTGADVVPKSNEQSQKKGFFGGLTLRRNTLRKEMASPAPEKEVKSTPSTPNAKVPKSPTIAQKGRSTTFSSMDSKDAKARKIFLTPPVQTVNPPATHTTSASAPTSTNPSPATPSKADENSAANERNEKRGSIFEGVPALENMTARDWAAREIYTSEIQYCRHLDTIVNVYMNALKDICSPEEMKFLFSNIVVLRNFGHKLLQELEDRMRNWATGSQCVGDIFLKFFPFMRAYNQYCNNYDDAVETLVECMKRPNFASFCKEQLALTPGGLGPDLQSLLINPVQRIPRYALLIKEVLQKTPKDHPDYLSLSTALDKITEITASVNISIKQFDKSKMYDKVIATVSGIMPYMAPHRKYVMEDSVVFPSLAANNIGKVQVQYWVILFTDMLFIASGYSPSDRKLEKHFPGNAIWVQDLPEVGDSSFQIITPEETYVAQFQSAEEKKKWYSALVERINQAFKEDVSNKPERFFEYKYPNGDLFQGEWNLGKMHGKGKYNFGNGKVYEGEFVAGFMEGFGVLDYGNGMNYTGQWKQGAPHGQGTLVQPGVTFVGEWKAGAKKKGTIEWSNNNKYVGKLKHDKLEGFGVFTCANGDKYQGEWKADKRHGHGIFSSSLYKYEGTWSNDKKEGNGKVVYSNGDIYEGAWKSDMRHGKGKFITHNTTYNGTWVNDKREGKGVLVLKAKSRPHKDDSDQEPFIYKYDGEWKADKKSGQGMLVSSDYVYEGSWLNDMKDGKGTLTDSSGSYAGYWKEDKRHGVGIFTSREGVVIRGKWQDDLRVGDGEISYTNSQGKAKVEKIRNEKLKHDDTGFNSVPPEIPNIKLFY